MQGGDDCTKGIEGRTAQEYVVGCGCVNYKEADWDCFCLGSFPKDGMEVYVASGGYLFARKPYMGSSYGIIAVSGSCNFW